MSRKNLLGTLPTAARELSACALSRDGERLILAYAEQPSRLEVWDLAGHQRISILANTISYVWEVTFSRDGRTAFACGTPPAAQVFDVATGRELAAIPGDLVIYFCLALSPDETRLALAGTGPVSVWDLTSHPPQQLLTLHHEAGWLSQMAFTPDGNTLVARSDNGVRVWRAPPLSETDGAKEAK